MEAKTDTTDEKSKELNEIVKRVKEEFLKDVEENKDLYHEEDIRMIKEDDWQTTRYVLRQRKNPEASVEMMKTSLRWSKEFGVNEMKDTDFPQEFYKIGGIFPYGKDLQGNGMVFMRVKMHKKIAELDFAVKHFIIYNLKKVDKEMNGRGMILMFDCEGAGISNADLDMLWFLVTVLNKYYPKGLSYVLVYELPWILSAVWKVVKSWLSEEHRRLIKFANKKNLNEFIDLDNLPDYMGGTCTIDYRAVPKGCPTAEEVAKERGVTEQQVEKMMNTFKPFLLEAEHEMSKSLVTSG